MLRFPNIRSVVLIWTLLASVLALADSRARIVRLSYIEGDVQLEQRDGEGFRKAFLNMPIGQGTQIALHGDARAEVEFENGSTLRLAREAQIGFSELGLRDDGNKFTVIDIARGTVYGDIKKSSSDQFDIRLLRRTLSLHKSARFRANLDADNAQVSVFNGELDFTSDGHASALKKNQSVSFDRENDASLAFDNRVVTDPLDGWDNERRDYRDRYFSASSYNYPSGYRYGFADLAYYGDYAYVPGWGRVWRPYGVDAAWQPYQDGSWVWYPYSGWTWVSAYPWGWTPYRYGNWLFVNGYGWCWRPAYTYVSWVPVVTVINPPPVYHVPVPPVGHGGPPVFVGNNGGGGGRSSRENWYREIRDNDPRLLGGNGGKQIGPAPPRRDVIKKDESPVAPAPVVGRTQSGKPILGPAPPRKSIAVEDEGATTQSGSHSKPDVGPAPPPRRLVDDGSSADNSSGKPAINPAPPERRIVNQNDSGSSASGGHKNPPPAPPQRSMGDGNPGSNGGNSGSGSRAPSPPPSSLGGASGGYSGGSGSYGSGSSSGPSRSSGGGGSGSPKSDSGSHKAR